MKLLGIQENVVLSTGMSK